LDDKKIGMNSLHEEYDYLKFTVLDIPIEQVEAYLSEALFEEGYSEWRKILGKPNIKRIYYPYPPKGINHSRKILIWQPEQNKNSTIFFCNLEDGWNTLMLAIGRKFNRKQYTFTFSNSNSKESIHSFFYYDGKRERLVRAMKDPRWDFYEYGEPLDFEHSNHYDNRIIKNRLNNKILDDYLCSVGYDMKNEGFWASKIEAIYFEEILGAPIDIGAVGVQTGAYVEGTYTTMLAQGNITNLPSLVSNLFKSIEKEFDIKLDDKVKGNIQDTIENNLPEQESAKEEEDKK
jgi:hypothetical protein